MPLIQPDETFSALLFDCDGTLVDTAPSHLFAYNHALRQVGLEMSEGFYLPRFGLAPQDLLSEFGAMNNQVLDLDDVIGVYSAAYQADLSRLREIPLVAEIARAYHGRVPMAVVSNGRRSNVERTLEAVGLRGLFDELVTIEDVTRGKPEPDLYLEAARRLGAAPADCIVFEDTDEGLSAGKAAGARVRDIREHLKT